MKIFSGIAVASLMIMGLMFASTDSMSQGDCVGNHTIQVSVGEGDVAVLKYRGGSAENVHVCNGDQLQWVLTGPDRDFLVDFADRAPFPGATKRGSSDSVLSVVIEGEVDTYTYDLTLNGGQPLDPHIIIDR